jgi:uncharacterized RDD family membrane protein YckC
LDADVRNFEIVPGVGGKDRAFAASFDELFIIILGFIAVLSMPTSPVWRVTAFVAIYLAYYFLFEAIVGSTPGKLVFGLWVRRLGGGKCTWRQAAVRTLTRLIEVNPLVLGNLPAGLTILATRNRQRIGDLCAGTAVRRGRAD